MSTESPLPSESEPFNDTDPVKGSEPVEGSNHAADSTVLTDEDGVLYDEEVTAQQGIAGFTLRELLIVGVWLIAFVTSFFPLHAYEGSASLWAQGIQWILALGLPTAAVFLIVLRRFSPEGIRRVGSLGIDQFASVAFSVSALFWAAANWDLMIISAATGEFALSWLTIVQLVASLALVVLTVFAPLIPQLRDDFRGRLVTLAHRNANPARPVIARPRAEKPAPASQEPSVVDREPSGDDTADEIAHLGLGDRLSSSAHASSGELGDTSAAAAEIGLGTTIGADDGDYLPAYARTSRGQFELHDDPDAVGTAAADETADPPQVIESAGSDDLTDVIDDLDVTAPRGVAVPSEPAAETPVEPLAETSVAAPVDAAPVVSSQPFWALAPTERDVLDERGEPLFRIGPSAWALVIEDRGGAYVVRHDDGRVGYLHDIADITKG